MICETIKWKPLPAVLGAHSAAKLAILYFSVQALRFPGVLTRERR